MEVIDEQGNLFGTVNIIDALVLVLVIGVIVAGVAVLGGDSTEGETGTRYVTIELNDQPVSVARQVSEGDTMVRDGQSLTVTDVYVAPGESAAVSLTVAAKVVGRETGSDRPIRFAGTEIRPNELLEIDTIEYDVTGSIAAVHGDDTHLNASRTTVTIDTTVDGEVARVIRQGDAYELAGHEVATVDSVSVFPTAEDGQRRVLVDVDLWTLHEGKTVRFGRTPVRVGSTVPLANAEYNISGSVIDHERLENGATTDTVSAVVKLENVDPEFVESIGVGDEERSRGTTFARVTDKRVEPASVILTSDDGHIYEREHPRNKDVYLTVDLTVRETEDGLRFHGERLQQRNVVLLDFGTITVNGTVVDVNDGS